MLIKLAQLNGEVKLSRKGVEEEKASRKS